MSELTLQRIPFTVDVDNRLRQLKARTGITPNILCRMGFCMSLEEPGIPMMISEEEEIGREINRYTLLGKYDTLFVALVKTWMQKSNISQTKIDEFFVAHMNQGADLIASRAKGIADIPPDNKNNLYMID